MKPSSARYALFRCCVTSLNLPEYELASDAILAGLDLKTVTVKEFGCCGYPLRNLDQQAWLLASARNLALAETYAVTVMTFCNCCFGTLRHCAWLLARDKALKARINAGLQKEGLHYTGTAKVRHGFEVLDEDVGMDNLSKKVSRPARCVNLAIHYGCRILRPSGVVTMGNPFHPTFFDRLVTGLGARSIPWQRKTDCCGAPVMATDKALSAAMASSKLSDAAKAGAEAVCVACPFCQLRLGGVLPQGTVIPVVSYPQLLAEAMGYQER